MLCRETRSSVRITKTTQTPSPGLGRSLSGDNEIPGISRSGATIAVALLLGIKREKAFKFSFLLSIPAILGALGYTGYTEFSGLTLVGLEWSEILAGAIAAMLVGYFALKLLWKTITKEKFHLFAFYCWILGAVLVLLSVF